MAGQCTSGYCDCIPSCDAGGVDMVDGHRSVLTVESSDAYRFYISSVFVEQTQTLATYHKMIGIRVLLQTAVFPYQGI